MHLTHIASGVSHNPTIHRSGQTFRRLRRGLVGLVVAFPLLATAASAQWTQQSPIPTYLDVRGVAALSPTHLFLATEDDRFDDGGALFESADGGATWTQRDVPFSLATSLNGLMFLDDQHGWAWGNVNYRTSDGGATWTELPLLGSTYFMGFYSTDFGLATGNFGAQISHDGGLTWSPSPQGMFAFDFADATLGLGTAADGLYRTVDGGLTFTPVQSGAAAAVRFLTPTLAVAIVDDTFLRSTDGGATWTPGSAADGRSELTVLAADVVLAWGRGGSFPNYDDQVLRSADGGLTWTDLGEIMPGGSLAFTVTAPTTVVAADLLGNLYRSSDQGATWTQVFVSPSVFPSFLSGSRPFFADAQTGYFAVGPGFIVKSTDGGASWTQISSGSSATLLDLDRFANGDLIAVGNDGQVLLSTAGGMPWRRQRALSAEDLEAVQVIGPQDVVTVDRAGIVYRSADAGASWTAGAPLPLGATARDLHFESPLDGWVVGSGFNGAALFHTVDGGASWTPVTSFQGTYIALDFAAGSGWTVSSSGLLYRSTDAGATWVQGQLPGSPSIRDLDFHDAAVGYAVGGSGYAARSDDGGESWQILPTPSTGDLLTDLYLLGPDELWCSTADGRALYSATGGQSWAIMEADDSSLGTYAAIAATPGGDAWMAGWRGSIQHFAGPPPPPVNRPPVASYDFVTNGFTVAFTDTSHDADGSLVSWSWSFGDGTSSTAQHPTHTFTEAGTFHVALTVTDDDGDSDGTLQFIVVQAGPGGTFGNLTEVTPLDPLFVTPQDEDFWVATAAPADFDSDGDLDIAVLGFYVVYNVSVEEKLVLLRNDGQVGPEEWDFAYLDVPLGTLSSGASDLAWSDIDGDGDPDLAVGSDGQTILYRNDGGTLLPTDTVLPAYLEDNDQADFDLRSITWADFDNDGDADLLLPSVWDGATFSYRTALLRNDGSNGTGGWLFTEVAAGLAPTRHAQSAWADDDGDQDLDLLLVHLSPLTDEGFIRRYRNDGQGGFTGEDVLGALTVEHGEAQWGDYDDDGDLDILIAGHIQETDGSFNRVLRIYRNDLGTYVPVEVISCPSCEGWIDINAATWADYDSDGDMDILVAGSYNSGSQIEGRAIIYENQGGSFIASPTQLPAPLASGSRGGTFSWLDLDGDGDLDYFIAGQYFVPGGNGLVEAQMHAYRNDVQSANEAPTSPSMVTATVDGTGSVLLAWNPASDDLTPAHALTYDVRLYRGGVPVAPPIRLPESGGLGDLNQWVWDGLSDGSYSCTVQAVDSAYNGGTPASASFTVGDPALLFRNGFESGTLAGWSNARP